MRRKVLLGCGAFLVIAAIETKSSLDAQGTAQTVNVDVRVDCLAGRGVSFSLMPWSITMRAGDSINWRLDEGANVSEMQVIAKAGGPWPFRRRPPFRSTKAQPAGAGSLDPGQTGRRYQYAVSALCVRNATTTDTVIIDPDMIIIRGGGT
jgi:hypothetical protein